MECRLFTEDIENTDLVSENNVKLATKVCVENAKFPNVLLQTVSLKFFVLLIAIMVFETFLQIHGMADSTPTSIISTKNLSECISKCETDEDCKTGTYFKNVSTNNCFLSDKGAKLVTDSQAVTFSNVL